VDYAMGYSDVRSASSSIVMFSLIDRQRSGVRVWPLRTPYRAQCISLQSRLMLSSEHRQWSRSPESFCDSESATLCLRTAAGPLLALLQLHNLPSVALQFSEGPGTSKLPARV
jgi:hypothetical protein